MNEATPFIIFTVCFIVGYLSVLWFEPAPVWRAIIESLNREPKSKDVKRHAASINDIVRNEIDTPMALLIMGILLSALIFGALIITAAPSWEYQDIAGVFEQCIADDTFTREECVIIAGGGK